ncbi:MAG: ubiquinol-cytochrome c reductase iron-sulfur subunit [Gemmatimonadales bacterium]|nr:ubiquinol-cytochrome c reductase iron-sulfur subunit [Gemmatimonadales bacterium]
MAGMLTGCSSLVATPVTPVAGKVRLTVRNFPALSRPRGALKILPQGQETPLYVLAEDDGGYAVLSPICTHLGCTVDVDGATLLCPCHGSTYDRRGRVLRGPAERPLRRYPSHLSDGVLEIDLREAA